MPKLDCVCGNCSPLGLQDFLWELNLVNYFKKSCYLLFNIVPIFLIHSLFFVHLNVNLSVQCEWNLRQRVCSCFLIMWQSPVCTVLEAMSILPLLAFHLFWNILNRLVNKQVKPVALAEWIACLLAVREVSRSNLGITPLTSMYGTWLAPMLTFI